MKRPAKKYWAGALVLLVAVVVAVFYIEHLSSNTTDHKLSFISTPATSLTIVRKNQFTDVGNYRLVVSHAWADKILQGVNASQYEWPTNKSGLINCPNDQYQLEYMLRFTQPALVVSIDSAGCEFMSVSTDKNATYWASDELMSSIQSATGHDFTDPNK